MEHNAPHAHATFEGYYNKFSLTSGAHIVIVICKVSGAKSKANLVTLTYVPAAHHGSGIYQKEIVTDDIEMRRTETRSDAFVLDIPALGHAAWNGDSSSKFHLKSHAFEFQAMVSPGVSWSENNCTPEGPFIRLPLPLHWHVQTLASPGKFNLKIADYDVPPSDTRGEAIVHQEKNWATSFPSAHMWVQCREGDRGFCCAGGKILGMEAFLLGYRSKDLDLDFRPPFALRFLGIGPFMSYKADWKNRCFDLTVQSFWQKITVKAQAPEGSFFPLSAPFSEGHRKNFLNQSLQARIEIEIHHRAWIGSWQEIRKDVFEQGSLEFGGAFYPHAGSEQEFN